MGFSQSLAEKAVEATGNQNIEAAMDWLIVHAEDSDKTSSLSETAGEGNNENKSYDERAPVAKSFKCDECNKLFRSSDEVEFHAAKTGHSQFSESTDEKKPLTEEEKREQLQKVEELMKQKRKEREEKEKAEQLEQEKKRIQSGKELSTIRKKLEDEEIKKMAEERRREKEEEKRHRQKVKDQIEQDKLARKQKFGATSPLVEPTPVVAAQPQTPVVPNQPKDYKETRIQIRLTNGSTLTHNFGSKEQLAAVRLYIQMNRTDVTSGGSAEPFRIQTNFPRKVFSEEEYDATLEVLGLVPSAVLMVSKG